MSFVAIGFWLFNLIGWEDGASVLDQSQRNTKSRNHNFKFGYCHYFDLFKWKLLKMQHVDFFYYLVSNPFDWKLPIKTILEMLRFPNSSCHVYKIFSWLTICELFSYQSMTYNYMTFN